MVDITWLIVLAVIGVIAGFLITDRLLESRGLTSKKRVVRVNLKDLGRYLRDKYLVNVAVISGNDRQMYGVDEFEVDEIMTTLSTSGSDEVLFISESDYRYATKRGDVLVYIHGKFLSLEDFSEVWLIVQNALREVIS